MTGRTEDKPRICKMPMILFSYRIVLNGGGMHEALATGHLYASSVAAARKHVNTVRAPELAGRSGLEVILHDSIGSEIWRGLYQPRPQ